MSDNGSKRGGARSGASKRFAKAMRDRKAAKLYTSTNPDTGKPFNQREISERLGIGQTQISRGLKETFDRFQRQAVDFIRKHRESMVARSVQRYGELEAAWIRSQQDASISRVERTLGGADKDGKPVVVDTKAIQTKEGQVGDPRFVGLMRLEDEHLAKLLGLYEQAEHVGPEIPVQPGDTLVIRVANSPNGQPKVVSGPEEGGGGAQAGT